MAHEKSITVEIEGDYFNIPTVVNGKQMTDREAVDYHSQNKSLGRAYNSQEDAVKDAERRSRSFDKTPAARKRKR